MAGQCPNTDDGKHKYEWAGNENGETVMVCTACGDEVRYRQ